MGPLLFIVITVLCGFSGRNSLYNNLYKCRKSCSPKSVPVPCDCVACDQCIVFVCAGECTTFTLNLALKARSRALGPLSPSFALVKNLREALDNFLPDNAHEIASGRLHISLTRVSDKQNVLISQFSDKNDLMDVSRYSPVILMCPSLVLGKLTNSHAINS